jgi:hypothetical protein
VIGPPGAPWCARRPGPALHRAGAEDVLAGFLRATTPHLAALGVALCSRRSQMGRIMPNHFAPGAQRAGWEAGIARANRIAAEVAPVIAELRAAGITSKKGIAKALNRRAVRTPRGIGEWRAIQVARVLSRLEA